MKINLSIIKLTFFFCVLIQLRLSTHLAADNVYFSEDTYEACETPPIIESSCPINDSYTYVTLGVGPIIFIPNVGVGYRERHGSLGWDTALSFSTIGYAHQLSAHIAGHYYFTPRRQNSHYIGLGLIGSGIVTNHKDGGGTLSPDFIFGKELASDGNSKHFLEMHVAMPTLWMGNRHLDPTYIPLMYIKYGISF